MGIDPAKDSDRSCVSLIRYVDTGSIEVVAMIDDAPPEVVTAMKALSEKMTTLRAERDALKARVAKYLLHDGSFDRYDAMRMHDARDELFEVLGIDGRFEVGEKRKIAEALSTAPDDGEDG